MVPKTIKYITTAFICSILFIGCYYDVEEELYPSNDCETADMSLATDITPILNNYNCNGCHSAASNSGSVDLEGYTALKIWVDNGVLLKSIKHDGASPMPKAAPKMAQCDIDKVAAWIQQGAKDN